MSAFSRRTLLQYLAIAGASLGAGRSWGAAPESSHSVLQKTVPASGERLCVIGMGTWQTFNVGSDPVLRDARTEVLQAFFAGGGQMVDSSPMYGSSQAVLGYALEQLQFPKALFAADKIWTSDEGATRSQLRESAEAWRLAKFDLMQVHNLLSWQAHLDALEALKEQGKIRYLGITTSHGRRLQEFERVMQKRDLDFVQLTYNLADRWAEQRLLPLAKEKGTAVIANRPFGGGALVDRFQRSGEPLPAYAGEIDCQNWPQFLLKFIVSHPAVTCAIPATTRVTHMQENMGAARGALPDAALRAKMLQALQRV